VTAEGLEALASLTRLTDLDLFQCQPRFVSDKSLRATLALLTGLTRLDLSGCEIGSLTKHGLAAAVAPLTCLTTLLPPAREVSSTAEYEYDSYGDYSDDDEYRSNSSDYDDGYCECGECDYCDSESVFVVLYSA
jgi:hypothetical protein